MSRVIILCAMTALPVQLAGAARQSTQLATHSPGLSSADLLQWASGLSIIIVLILLCAVFLRRFGQVSSPGGSRLKLLGGISVGTRERVVLVQAGKQQLVLGVAPGRVETLHVMDQTESSTGSESNAEEKVPMSFSQRLQQGLGRG